MTSIDSLSHHDKELLEALLADDTGRRLSAIRQLKKLPDDSQRDRILQALLQLIENAEQPLSQRQRGLSVLTWLEDPRLVEPLLEFAQKPDLREAAIRGLGHYTNDDEVLAVLFNALEDTREKVQEAAIQTLHDSKPPAAVMPLLHYIKKHQEADDRLNLRAMAIRVLGAIGDRRAVEPLQQLHHRTHDEAIASATEQALRSIDALDVQ